MADTAIAITAGAGTNVDTRTEATNGNHRQVVVLGDPSTNAGVAPVDATTGLAVNVTNASLTVASHAVTNAGTFVVQENGTWVQVDDAAFTPATSKVAMVGAEFDDTSPDSVDEGDGGAVRMSANRNLYVRIRDNAGNERGLNIDTNGAAAVAATHASGSVASGAFASGSIASGAVASGAVASGAFASGSIASGAIAAGAIAAGASSIAENEDASSADGDRGVKVLAVRKATPANTSGTDGDYEFLQMSAGRIWASATVDAALPAGTNAIGKLAANSGVDIGDVDITSLVPGVTATSLGKAEDAAHSSGDTGVMALAVRQDTASALAGTDGDYIPLTTDSRGYLRVTIDPTQTNGAEYETVAASQTAQVLGATGGTGDFVASLLIVPATTSPGNVLLLDNATSITVFTGGASSVSNLAPIYVPLGMTSVSGAWKVTTGASVSVIAVGNFT